MQSLQTFAEQPSMTADVHLLREAMDDIARALRGASRPAMDVDYFALEERVQKTVRSLTDPPREILRVEIIDAYNPMPRPSWMSEKVYSEAIRSALWNHLDTIFANRVLRELGTEKGISTDMWVWLGGWSRDLIDALRVAFAMSPSAWPAAQKSMFDLTFAVCGYAVAGRRDRVDQLRPLLAEMERGFLLVGEQRGHPEVLLFLDTYVAP